jgi:two-component system OmpR family response regulator
MANILIVDDDADIAELSSEIFVAAGHVTKTRANGEEGLTSLHSGPLPDCILLDVEMPALGGPAMAHRMLLHDAGEEKIPILLVSGRSDLTELAARMGTPYFLKKGSPDYRNSLLRILARALSERLAPTSA